MKEIYLDNASTTPIYKEVIKEMNKSYLEDYGNPSSLHKLGEKARNSVNKARTEIAREINANPSEIIFTSGATESNNLAFFGLAKQNKKKNKILISSIEHSSIFEISEALKKEGYKIIEIPIDSQGFVDIPFISRNIDNNTLLVSVIHTNNEIGVIQDIESIGKICKSKNILFHTDAAQSFGKLNIDAKKMNIDLLSAGAHKIGGPKGAGFLYIKENLKIMPLFMGADKKEV